MSKNNITSISTDVFSESLKVLKLHDNKITKIDDSVIQHLTKQNISLTELSLYNNPLECDCKSQILFKISSINNSFNIANNRCKNYNEFLYKVNFTHLCTVKNSSVSEIHQGPYEFSFKVFGLIVTLTILLTIFVYYYREKVKSLICHSFSYIQRQSEEDESDVSFSHGDTDYFHKELVPKLEKLE